ncbi:hypothetical protein EVAR_84810_1 [Eumeta japonica]|uniref:Uncharacterized protein n=1 Tax=Eumeta variegata TaxID=151549 RepID=A0A4C1U8Z3_EUMVA|nr:hypothetical protein EVAR_84810_1 [Eumeta japonica]
MDYYVHRQRKRFHPILLFVKVSIYRGREGSESFSTLIVKVSRQQHRPSFPGAAAGALSARAARPPHTADAGCRAADIDREECGIRLARPGPPRPDSRSFGGSSCSLTPPAPA